MAKRSIIVAVGGGGFTHGQDPALDDYCLSQAGARPALGYVGMASGDAAERIERFYDRFRGLGTELSHLEQDTDRSTLRDWLAGKDLIYFSGGDTGALIVWMHQDDRVALFRAANASGTVLAGVSAGGICWFEQIMSDAGGKGLAPLRGLGLVSGSVCPHYSTEPDRPPAFCAAVARGALPAGVAIDDGACVIAENGQVTGVFSARPGAGAYRVSAENGKAVQRRIASRLDG